MPLPFLSEADGLYRQFEQHVDACPTCQGPTFCEDGLRLFLAWNRKQDDEEVKAASDRNR